MRARQKSVAVGATVAAALMLALVATPAHAVTPTSYSGTCAVIKNGYYHTGQVTFKQTAPGAKSYYVSKFGTRVTLRTTGANKVTPISFDVYQGVGYTTGLYGWSKTGLTSNATYVVSPSWTSYANDWITNGTSLNGNTDPKWADVYIHYGTGATCRIQLYPTD